MFDCGHYSSKRLKKGPGSPQKRRMRVAALFLCLSILTGFLSVLTQAADRGKEGSVYRPSTPSDGDRTQREDKFSVYGRSTPQNADPDTGERFSDIVHFDSITLHYAGSNGEPEGAAIEDGALIEKGRQLVLDYTYTISEEKCNEIKAGTRYYLEVSPHLEVTHLEGGAPLKMETEGESSQQFGTIYADGSRAWVTFLAKEEGGDTVLPDGDDGDTVLSDSGGLEKAYFYLNCSRAAQVPETEPPIEGHSNLYVMKFENEEQLRFGYAENQPVTAEAHIKKGGSLSDKTITWEILYTPWQNPCPDDPVTQNTSFELRDTITPQHGYVENSAKMDGQMVTSYTRRGVWGCHGAVCRCSLPDFDKNGDEYFRRNHCVFWPYKRSEILAEGNGGTI